MTESYYDRLGVQPDASTEAIKTAYRRLARRLHPDIDPSPTAAAEFKRVSEAYTTLCDSRKRLSYNQSLLAQATAGPIQESRLDRRDLWAAWERVLAYAITAGLLGWIIQGTFWWLADNHWVMAWPVVIVSAVIGVMRGIDENFVVGDFVSRSMLWVVRCVRLIVWGGGFGYLTLTLVPIPLMILTKSDDLISRWSLILIISAILVGSVIASLATLRDH